MLIFPRRNIFQASGPDFPIADIAKGLQVYYPFGEGGGNTIRSAITNAWPATFSGTTPSWQSSILGSAVNFDGSTNWIDIPDGNSSGATITPGIHMADSPCTISVWMYWKSATEGYNSVFAKEHGGGGFTLLLKSDQTVAFYKTNAHTDPISATTVPFNQWVHLAFTDDSTTFTLYINGKLIATAGSGTTAGPFTDTAFIGKSIFGGGRFFQGYMAHFGLWSRALLAAEIGALYVDPNALFRQPKKLWASVPSLNSGATIVGQGVETANGIVYEFSGATITGQGVETANGGSVVFGAGSIVGQCILTGNGSIVVVGGAAIIGEGLLQMLSSCPRDAVVTLYLIPLATVAVVMPIAFVTSIGALNNTITCGVNQDTIPVTGSFNSLVELSGVPQNNQ